MNSLTITNHLNEILYIDLTRPENSGLVISYINGLGPVKANINMDQVAVIDGSQFNSSRAVSRNVVLGIQLFKIPGFTITEMRHKIYKYFPLKRKIKLVFDNGIRQAYTFGYVESNEATIFSKDAGNIVSVVCENSYLYDVVGGHSIFGSSTGRFTFPFSNEALTRKLLIMGNVDLKRENIIVYTGEASTGFLLHIHANANATDLILTETKSLGVLGIDSDKLETFLGSDIITGDDIYISTVIGKKYAYLIRQGVVYNILDCLLPNPTWFQLEKGENKYAYSLGDGYGNIDFTISFNIAYEGM